MGLSILLLAVVVGSIFAQRGYGEGIEDFGEKFEVANPHLQMSPWNVFGGLGVRSQVIYDSQAPMIGSHMLFNRTQASRSALGYFVEPYISRWRSDFNAGLTMSKTLSHGSPHDEGLTEMNAFDLQSNFEFGLFPQSRFPASFYFNRYDSSNSEGGSSGHGSSRVSQKIGLKQDYRNDTNDLSASLQGEHRNDNMGERSRPKWQTLFLPGMGNKEGTNVSDMLSLRLDKRFTKNTIGMTVRSTNNLRTTVVNTTKSRDHGATLTHGYNPKENFSVNNLVTMGLFYNDYLTRDLGNVFGGELRERMMDDQQQIGTDLFWRAMERPISLSAAIRVAQQEEEYQLGVNDDGYETNRLRRGANTRFGGMYQFNEHNTMTGYLTGNYDVIEQQDALNDMESAIASTTQVLAHQYDSPTTQWFSFDHRWYSNTSLVNSIADLMKPSQNIQERLGHGVRRIFEKNKGWGTFRTSVDESVGLNEKLPDSELAADVTHGASLGYESGSDTKPTLIDLRLMDTHTLSPEAMEQQMANLQFSRSGMKSDNGGWQGNITLNLSRLSNEDGLVTIARSGGINASVTNLGIFGVDDLRNELSSTLTSSMVSLGSIEPVYHELRIQDLLYYHIGKLTVRLGGEISVLGDDTGITSTLGLVTLEATREYHRRF